MSCSQQLEPIKLGPASHQHRCSRKWPETLEFTEGSAPFGKRPLLSHGPNKPYQGKRTADGQAKRRFWSLVNWMWLCLTDSCLLISSFERMCLSLSRWFIKRLPVEWGHSLFVLPHVQVILSNCDMDPPILPKLNLLTMPVTCHCLSKLIFLSYGVWLLPGLHRKPSALPGLWCPLIWVPNSFSSHDGATHASASGRIFPCCFTCGTWHGLGPS